MKDYSMAIIGLLAVGWFVFFVEFVGFFAVGYRILKVLYSHALLKSTLIIIFFVIGCAKIDESEVIDYCDFIDPGENCDYVTGKTYNSNPDYLPPPVNPPTNLVSSFTVEAIAGSTDESGNIPSATVTRVVAGDEARFSKIGSLAVYQDYLYLTDTDNHLIKRIDLKSAPVRASWFIGSGLMGTDIFDQSPTIGDVAANELSLANPKKLAVTKKMIYFSTNNGRVVRFDIDGRATNRAIIDFLGQNSTQFEASLLEGIVPQSAIRLPNAGDLVFSPLSYDIYVSLYDRITSVGNKALVRRISIASDFQNNHTITNFTRPDSTASQPYDINNPHDNVAVIGGDLFFSDLSNLVYKISAASHLTPLNPASEKVAKVFAGTPAANEDIDGQGANASFNLITDILAAGNFLYLATTSSDGKSIIRIISDDGNVTTPQLQSDNGSSFSFPTTQTAKRQKNYISSLAHYKDNIFIAAIATKIYKLTANF